MSPSDSGPPAPRPRKLVLRKIPKDGAPDAPGTTHAPPSVTSLPSAAERPYAAPPGSALPPPTSALPPPRPRAPSFASIPQPVPPPRLPQPSVPHITLAPAPSPLISTAPRIAAPPQITLPHAPVRAPRSPSIAPIAREITPAPPAAGGYASPPQPFVAHAAAPGSTPTTAATPLPSRVSVLPMVASVAPYSTDASAGRGTQRRSLFVVGALAAVVAVALFALSRGPGRDEPAEHATATSGATHPLAHSTAATLAAASQPAAVSPPLVFTANVNDLPRAPGPRRVAPWAAPVRAAAPQARVVATPPPATAAPAAAAPQAQAAAAGTDDQDDQDTAPTTSAPVPAPTTAKAAPPPEPAAPPPAPAPTEVTPPAPVDPLLREIQKAVEDPSRNK
jgi:hypothetical protein